MFVLTADRFPSQCITVSIKERGIKNSPAGFRVRGGLSTLQYLTSMLSRSNTSFEYLQVMKKCRIPGLDELLKQVFGTLLAPTLTETRMDGIVLRSCREEQKGTFTIRL